MMLVLARSNGMRSNTLVELHMSNEMRSNLVEHVGSKFVIPFLESKQHCASPQVFGQASLKSKNRSEIVAIFPKFSYFDTIQSEIFTGRPEDVPLFSI